MSKKQKVIKRPNLSPVTLLRPRLDGLLQNEAWGKCSQTEAFADLDAVCRGIAPGDFLPILASAVEAAPYATRERVNAVVGAWLVDRSYMAALAELAAKGGLPPAAQHQGAVWLQEAGYGQIVQASKQVNEFAAAFYGQDEFGSQGLLTILWYAHSGSRDATGLQFLLDYNPPWYGSIKDVLKFPRRRLNELIDYIRLNWSGRTELRPVDAVEAKMQAILHLENNRTQGIRLHRDLIALRDLVIQQVLTLPDGPKTPPFEPADFDELCDPTWQTTESIMHFERTVGRQVVLPDGKRLFVGADLTGEPD